MEVTTRHTEEQKVEFKRLFVVRRRRRRLVVVSFLALVVAVLILRLRGVEEVFGVPSGHWGLYVFGYGVLSVLFSLVNWRCPACNRPLGRYGNPRFCFRCGAPLQYGRLAGRYFFTMSRSSTSNTRVAPGLICGGAPRSP